MYADTGVDNVGATTPRIETETRNAERRLQDPRIIMKMTLLLGCISRLGKTK
jgi:hypothetical protein